MTQIDSRDEAVASPSRTRKPVIIAAGVVAAVALAFAGGAFTNALFTSQASVTGQTASTATVSIDAETATASTPIALTSMLPGDTASTVITLENTGTEGVYYTVRVPATAGGDAALDDVLAVTVAVGTASETRTLSDWQDGALQIAPALAASGTDTVTVTVELPLGTDNALQDLDTGFSLQFDAIQARNSTAPSAGWVAD
jgi:hypothetical protein